MQHAPGWGDFVVRAAVVGALAATIVIGPGRVARVAGQASPIALESIFDPGGLLQDRNADGVVDFVSARLVLGEDAGIQDLTAATDVAARLGFETSAMNLPVARDGDAAGIVAIGQAGARRAGIADIALDDLAAGEGAVLVRDIGGRPAVIAAGRDEAGNRAAAALLAGRLPYLDKPGGSSLHDLTDDVRSLLEDAKLMVRRIRIPSVRGTGAGDAYSRIDVEVDLGTAAEIAQARKVLAGLRTAAAPAHRPRGGASPETPHPAATGAAGQDDSEAEGPPLSYKGVALVRVHLTAPQGTPVQVDVAPAEAPAPGPIPARPGSGAKENLDLSNLYTPDGLLGDSDSNLIPDRLDALLVPNGAGVNRTVDLGARLGLESTGLVDSRS